MHCYRSCKLLLQLLVYGWRQKTIKTTDMNKMVYMICGLAAIFLTLSSCNSGKQRYEYYGNETLSLDTTTIVYAYDSVCVDTAETPSKRQPASSSSSHSTYSSSAAGDKHKGTKNNPEYSQGGKYDPELYHTDYSSDDAGEQQRREYIDNDGYDINDGYDEYYGYSRR